jgi:integrase/recombinase XerD
MNNLRKAVRQYINERAALGFKTYEHNNYISQFVNFMEDQEAAFITKKLALQWATLPNDCSVPHKAKRLGVIRQFTKYYAAIEPRTEVPPEGLLPYKYQRTQPYIYTKKQIVKLINAAKRIPSETGLRALTYSTFLGLLAVTGTRIGEAIYLEQKDVDLDEGMLQIRMAKLDRCRLVPLHPSTVKVLRRYVRQRDKIYPKAKTSSFFVSESGIRLTCWTVRWTFNKLSRQIGLRGPLDRSGPRIHDLRHTTVVNIVEDWYREGKNVEKLLPQLAMFIGHRHLNDTYWYMTATPELLKLAAKRAAFLKGRFN